MSLHGAVTFTIEDLEEWKYIAIWMVY
jgi:hypothetical protein